MSALDPLRTLADKVHFGPKAALNLTAIARLDGRLPLSRELQFFQERSEARVASQRGKPRIDAEKL